MSKHLFVVHSSITWRMTQAVIHYHQWLVEDCVILLDRGYQIDWPEVECHDISDLSLDVFRWQDKAGIWTKLRINYRHARVLKQLLDDKIGQAYSLFLPHSWSYTYWVLIEHDLCRSYAFIEEGTLSYNPDLSIYDRVVSGWKYWILRLLLTTSIGSRIPVYPLPLDYRHPKYSGCYGIDKRVFPSLPVDQKVLLAPPFQVNPAYANIENVLLPGPWLEVNYCSEEQYRRFKTLLFQYFADHGYDQLYVKFHPQQYRYRRSMAIFWEIANEFADRIQLIELPADTSPEEIAFSSSANFFLAYSSVAMYASQFGCKVFSYAQFLYDHWSVFRPIYDHLPAVITENMIPLDLEFA